MMVKNFVGIYSFNKFFSVCIILVQNVELLKLFIYSVNLPWLTLRPLFVNRQDQIATKNCVCLAKHSARTNKFYTGMPVMPVTNSMSGKAPSLT